MADADRAALYIRWILEEIGLIQVDPIPICADNQGVIHMNNAQKPTRRTRHVEIKNFIILQWTEDNYINFMETPTGNMHSNSLSKVNDRTKFYEHMYVLMGQKNSNIQILSNPKLFIIFVQQVISNTHLLINLFMTWSQIHMNM